MFSTQNASSDRARDLIAKRVNQVFSDSSYHRFLLINPPQFRIDLLDTKIARNRRYYAYPPYGLALLAAHMKKMAFDVQIIDLNFALLKYVHENAGVESIQEEQFHLLWKRLIDENLQSFKPEACFLTCMFTMAHKNLISISDYLKSKKNELPIVAGGVHVTNAWKNVLKEAPAIDFVSLYEGDKSVKSLLNLVNGQGNAATLTQIATLIDGKFEFVLDRDVPETSDMDILPDYVGLPLEEYSSVGEIGTFRFWRPKDARVSISLSNRGCRAKCSFCSVRNFNGNGVRGRSAESVVDEIEHLKNEHGISHITWLDDDLFFDAKRTIHLFNQMAKRNLNITWDASNGIIASAAAVCPELVDASAASGCIGMYFGVESGNREILKRIHKPSGIKHYLKVGELMRRYPQIFTRGFLIVGFPKETLGQIYDTVKMAQEMKLDWFTVQLLTPLPSTEIYKEMVDLGLIEQDSLNTDSTGFTMFSVRESERQRRIERAQVNSDAFWDFFKENLDHVPSKEELNSLWLLVDYKINYERILNSADPQYLKKMKLFLSDVGDRMTLDNPLPQYYLGIINKKLGDLKESERRFALSAKFLENSSYWKHRFKILGVSSPTVATASFPSSVEAIP